MNGNEETDGGKPPAGELRVALSEPLPPELRVGDGTALLLQGSCRHPSRRVHGLELCTQDGCRPVMVHDAPGPGRNGAGGAWWGMLSIEPVLEPRRERISLRADLGRGRQALADLGAVTLLPGAPGEPAPPASATANVAICMATWNPPPELFRRQVESIRSQSHPSWTCVISDDHSDPGFLAEIERAIAGDERFVLTAHADRLGFYGNFERAIRLAPPEATHVALCDQDDAWAEDKLASLLASFGPRTTLAYSDMRIVTDGGKVLSETYWNFRATNHDDLGRLLLANTVTGAASMLRRDAVESALPFPPDRGELFHDHWLASVALSLGEIAYVDRPLYDYVQHGEAALGHAQANFGARRPRRAWLRWLKAIPKVAIGRRVPSFYGRVFLPTVLMARVIETRCGPRLDAEKLAVVRALAARDGDRAAVAWLLPRAVRPGLRRTATLGRERSFLAALAWQRLARFRGRLGWGPIPAPPGDDHGIL